MLGWCDVVRSGNVKSTLKQRCVCQRWNLQRWKNVKPTLSIISTMILTTLNNVETMLFSKSIFTMLFSVETMLWIWPFEKEKKNIFEIKKKKDDSLIINTCFWLGWVKKKGKHGLYNVKINVGKYNTWYMKRIRKQKYEFADGKKNWCKE